MKVRSEVQRPSGRASRAPKKKQRKASIPASYGAPAGPQRSEKVTAAARGARRWWNQGSADWGGASDDRTPSRVRARPSGVSGRRVVIASPFEAPPLYRQHPVRPIAALPLGAAAPLARIGVTGRESRVLPFSVADAQGNAEAPLPSPLLGDYPDGWRANRAGSTLTAEIRPV